MTGPGPRKGAQRPNDRPVPDVAGRHPPADLAAELSINSTLLMYPARWFDVSWLAPSDFFGLPDRIVFVAIGSIVNDEGAVDGVTIRAYLETTGEWASVGMGYMTRLMTEGVINEPLLDRLADIVADKAKTRRVIALAQCVANEGYGPLSDERTWADEAPARFEALVQGTVATTGATARETLIDVFSTWQESKSTIRLGTGIPDLDRVFRMMRPTQVVVIGAHSGVGKSALAANIVDHVVTDEFPEGQPAGVFVVSAEMTRAEYIERMVFARARVDTYKLDEEKREFITPDEWAAITAASKALSVDHLYMDERADVTPSMIRTEARRVQARFKRAGTPLRLVVIDYAQIIGGDTENKQRHDNREQEVAQIARSSKKLAKELGVTVLLLAQLNEDNVKEKRRPRASDLRESRSLKQDADKVVLIYNPRYAERSAAYRNGEDRRDALSEEHIDLIVDKNRGGRIGTVAATYHPSFTLFTSYTGSPEDLERMRAEIPAPGKRRGS